MKKIGEVSNRVDLWEENKDRISKLFGYKTSDEPEYNDRQTGNLFVEVGGPCVHMKIGCLTRIEHTILKEALYKIINGRFESDSELLNNLCRKQLNKNV